MDISKAKRVFELEKEGKKVLVTLWEGDKISSCVVDEAKQYCDTCQGDEGLCQDFIDYLKDKGYQATEVELGEQIDESLPRFLETREVSVEPSVAVEPSVEPEVAVKVEPVVEE